MAALTSNRTEDSEWSKSSYLSIPWWEKPASCARTTYFEKLVTKAAEQTENPTAPTASGIAQVDGNFQTAKLATDTGIDEKSLKSDLLAPAFAATACTVESERLTTAELQKSNDVHGLDFGHDVVEEDFVFVTDRENNISSSKYLSEVEMAKGPKRRKLRIRGVMKKVMRFVAARADRH